uniref:Uncharacterized protein n=1 Tax=Arundo donax TaxID=35708 RepID=A0A0A9CJ99_ARUDO
MPLRFRASPASLDRAAHLVAGLEEHDGGAIVRERAGDDERVEDLVAVSGQVERPRPPPLRHPRQVERRAGQIRCRHGALVRQRHVPAGLVPVHGGGVHRRHHPRHAHADEQQRAVGAVPRRAQARRHKRVHGGHAGGGDRRQVHHLPVRLALEDVVDGREEGDHYHHRDARVVEPDQEQVQPVRVARQQVARAAAQQAEHGAAQEHEERPPCRLRHHRDAVGGKGWVCLYEHERTR